ncbi:MAG: phage/plasmid primase, P4 family [Micavibrio sp.]
MTNTKSSITILTCADNGKIATKKFHMKEDRSIEKTPYSSGTLFYHEEKPVSNLVELAEILENLRDEPTKLIIRGKIKENMAQIVRRKTLEPGATFDAVTRPYVMLDIDKLPCPDFFDPNENLEDMVRWAQNSLPKAFQNVSCYYKFSSSQSVYPVDAGEKTISIHLWYYCNRAVANEEWKRFFRTEGGPVDLTLFNAVQAHYTADPIFKNMDEPLLKRSGVYVGNHDVVEVPDIPEELKVKASERPIYSIVVNSDDQSKAIDFFIPYYIEGKRNRLSATIAAMLYRGGWSAENVANFVYELAEKCSDEEADERFKNAWRIFDAIDQGRRVPGIPTLKKEFEVKSLDSVMLLLGLKNPDLDSALLKLNNRSSADEIRTALRAFVHLSEGEANFFLDKISINTKTSKKSIKALFEEVVQESVSYLPTDWPDTIVSSYTSSSAGNPRVLRSSDKRYWMFNGLHWKAIPDDHVKKDVTEIAREYKAEAGISTGLSTLVTASLNLLEGISYERLDPLRAKSKDVPLVINCQNGGVWFGDNAEVSFRPHRADNYLRHCLKVDYDPSATCPQFDQMLLDIFSKSTDPKDMVRNFLEFAGYTCQPSRKIPTVVLLHGSGANGKSTLVSIICRILGDDAVMAGRINEVKGDKFKIGALDGKLMFYEDDVGTNTRLDDGFLKTISEEKILTGEHKFKDSFQFICRTVPIMLANDYPFISDLTHGLNRRLLVIPFDRRYEDHEQEKGIADRLWKDEASGILNLFIQGFQRVNRRGHFQEPQDCIKAKNMWLTRSNILPTFINDCCQSGEGLGQSIREFYSYFREYCERTGNYPIQRQQWVLSKLVSLDFEISSMNGEPYVRGIVAKSSIFLSHP